MATTAAVSAAVSTAVSAAVSECRRETTSERLREEKKWPQTANAPHDKTPKKRVGDMSGGKFSSFLFLPSRSSSL